MAEWQQYAPEPGKEHPDIPPDAAGRLVTINRDHSGTSVIILTAATQFPGRR